MSRAGPRQDFDTFAEGLQGTAGGTNFRRKAAAATMPRREKADMMGMDQPRGARHTAVDLYADEETPPNWYVEKCCTGNFGCSVSIIALEFVLMIPAVGYSYSMFYCEEKQLKLAAAAYALVTSLMALGGAGTIACFGCIHVAGFRAQNVMCGLAAFLRMLLVVGLALYVNDCPSENGQAAVVVNLFLALEEWAFSCCAARTVRNYIEPDHGRFTEFARSRSKPGPIDVTDMTIMVQLKLKDGQRIVLSSNKLGPPGANGGGSGGGGGGGGEDDMPGGGGGGGRGSGGGRPKGLAELGKSFTGKGGGGQGQYRAGASGSPQKRAPPMAAFPIGSDGGDLP